MRRTRSAARKQTRTTPNTVSTPISEDINHQHQTDRITRCLQNLTAAKKQQGVECDKLSKLRPTDSGFDVQAQLLSDATKKLIAARQSYLNCARSI